MPRKLRVEYEGAIYRVKEDSSAGRRQLEGGMEQRRELERSQENGEWKRLRRGWCFGPKNFREELLDQIGRQQGKQHCGEELRESEEQKAGRLIGQALKQFKWTEEDLKARRKGDMMKARLANRLRSETTVTWPWIAERLAMGHWRTALNAVRKVQTKQKRTR